MKKIPRDDPRAERMASDIDIDLDGLREHLDGKHRWVISTTRADGRPQMSLVTGGMTADGQLAVSSYPMRAKTINARRNPDVSVLVMGESFHNAWVQVDGQATVMDMPEGADAFVEYFRCISGEHSDWDEYRQAMADQGKSIIMIEPTRWSPVSRGGFPPEIFEDE
ncbi:MAG: PPOX class F420-dependent oxidoreductase [Actinomycetota bacterium]